LLTGFQLLSWRILKHHSELRLSSVSIRRPYFIRQYIQKVCMLFSLLEECITCYLVPAM
jgi:hypothetical protein